MSETIDLRELQRAVIFNELSDQDAQEARKDIRLVRLQPGEVLFRQGDEGDSIFLVVKGQLNVTLDVPGGGERVVSTLGPNNIIGEMSLLLDEPRTATVLAAGEAELWRIERQDFLESITWNEKWANQFLFYMAQLLARRLAVMNNAIVELVSSRQREESTVQWHQVAELRRHIFARLEDQVFSDLENFGDAEEGSEEGDGSAESSKSAG